MVEHKKDVAEIEKRIYSRILKPSSKSKKGSKRREISRREKIIASTIYFLIILIAAASIYYFNLFIALSYMIEADLAQIETQVQKRKNLIINLGKTVTDYSLHERDLFKYLGELRANKPTGSRLDSLYRNTDQASQVLGMENLAEDLANWENKLSNILAISEQYPDLKLSENFIKYMDAILEFENRIADLRMQYNSSVNLYSTKRNQIPGSIFGAVFKFEEYPYFSLGVDDKKFIYVEY